MTNKKGASFLGGIVILTISVVFIANVFLYAVHGVVTNATGAKWTSGEIALWGTIGLVTIAGFIYGIAALFGSPYSSQSFNLNGFFMCIALAFS